MHCYSSVLSRTSSLNHPISPKTYRSFLASLSSFLPRISQYIFPTIIFSNILDSFVHFVFNPTDPAKFWPQPNPSISLSKSLAAECFWESYILKLGADGLWPQWSPSVLPTFPSLSPQWPFKIPFSSNILHKSHLLSYPPHCPPPNLPLQPDSQFFLSL